MKTILVALEDLDAVDQVRTALRMFPGVRGVGVPRDGVSAILSGPDAPAAVIIDHRPEAAGSDPFIEQLRAGNGRVRVVACGERPQRRKFHPKKRELDVFSFVPVPLEPFDLLRRLHRLVADLSVAG